MKSETLAQHSSPESFRFTSRKILQTTRRHVHGDEAGQCLMGEGCGVYLYVKWSFRLLILLFKSDDGSLFEIDYKATKVRSVHNPIIRLLV